MNLYELVVRKATQYGIPPEMALRQVHKESTFRSGVTHPVSGAVGLMQIKPSTAENPGYEVPPMDSSLLKDPEANVDFGMRYLTAMKDKFGTWPLAFAAYNAGPGNVRDAGNEIPTDNSETVPYVDYITNGVLPDYVVEGSRSALRNVQTASLEKQNNDGGIFDMVDGATTGLPAGGLASFLNTLGDSSLSDEEELASIVGRLEADGVANPEGLASILFKAKKESENSAASSALTERQGLFQGLYDSGEAPRIDLIGEPAEVTRAPARRGGAPSGASALGRFGIESLVPSGG